MNESHSLAESCRALRADIKAVAAQVTVLHHHPDFGLLSSELPQGCNLDEAHANITLAYRHLEDAAMRLGKAIQAHDGGVSVYDK